MIFENKKRCRGHHGPHRLAPAARHRLAARRPPAPGSRTPPAPCTQTKACARTEREVQAVAPGREVQAAALGRRCRPPSRVKPSWGRGPGRRAGKGSRPPSRAGEDVQAAAPGRGRGRHAGEGGAGLVVPPYAPPSHLTPPLPLTAGEGRTEGGEAGDPTSLTGEGKC
jgi:hypothetical protein